MSPQPDSLKILHVISGDLWAGAEVQAYTLLAALHKVAGIEVAAALMNEGELARKLRACHIPVTVLDESRNSGLQILRALRKLMQEWQPDIVHTHRTKENVLGAIANRLSRRVPSLRTVHGAPEHAPRGVLQLHKKLFQRLDEWTGRHLQQRVIAVSVQLADKLATIFPSSSISVVENGIDVAAVQRSIGPVDIRSSAPDATHIGIVGRLVSVKRVDLFLRTAAKLRQTEPQREWRFHVFGDGPLRQQLGTQSEQLGVADITRFHGHRSDIVACLAALDALVMCSDHEGMPMTPLESIAAGTPVVAHAVGGLVDLLSGESGGLLVLEHHEQGYAAALLDLLRRDPAALLDKGLDRIQHRFSAEHNAQTVLSLYRELSES